MGANCLFVFGVAIPAFGYISSLHYEYTALIGAEGVVIFQSEFISDSNSHCERNEVYLAMTSLKKFFLIKIP